MKLPESSLISASNQSAWMKALELCGSYDIYHLPQYHLLAEKMGEGKPYLFFFHNSSVFAALPFLLRQVAEVEGIEECQHNDITSVYGYPGIVTSIREGDRNADDFRENFQRELLRLFEQLSVVAFFSRTNPLLPNTWMFNGFAETQLLSKTVAIDLTLKNEDQLGGMTKGHKYDIRKAHNNGVIVEEDVSFQYIEDFIQKYNETMKRNSASENYYFPKDYYLQLKKSFGESIRLYFARFEGQVVSASMFFMAGSIIQYHLSGSPSAFFSLNGAKLILDEIRRWGTQNGFSWLHLGGGVGSSEDSLYRFKAGFSKIRLPFEVVRIIIDQKIYDDLIKKRREWAQKAGYTILESNYFPDYRKPYQSNSSG